MQRTMLAVALAVTFGQASNPYAGTWIAEHSGKTHIRLELHLTNGALTGGLSLGDLEVNPEGEIRSTATAPLELTPIFDVVLRDSTLSFSRQEGDDTEHFELRLVADQADIRFILSEADRLELAEIGVAVPKPIRLRRVAP